MKPLVREDFNSINEFLRVINSRPNNQIMKNHHASQDDNYDFTKTHSYQEATEMLANGYDKILPEIKHKMNKKMKGTISQRRIPYNDIVGFAPNVPNAIRGIPQSMINKTVVKNKVRTVSIIYSPTGTGTIASDEFVKCGIVMMNVINNLELNGIRVNLKIACKASASDNERCLCCVKVKDYREHLDLRKLSFPVAHPSFFRRFGFKWLETSPKITDKDWSWGYGRTIHIDNFKDYKDFENDKLIDIRVVKELHYDYQKIIESFNLN